MHVMEQRQVAHSFEM